MLTEYFLREMLPLAAGLRGRRAVGPLLAMLLVSSGALLACDSGSSSSSSDDPEESPVETPEGVFESAHPSGTTSQSEGEATDNALENGSVDVAGTPGGSSAPAPQAAGADPAPRDDNTEEAASQTEVTRAIEEADIIKVSGDRLYALSQFGGLSVVDISDADDLRLLGRHRSTATPFEMYVRAEHVFVLYNGYGEYSYDEADDTWTFYQTSYVISLDASDPANIKESQRYEVEGYINDSRLIGDAMYVVAFDDSYCYRCGDRAETNVMSLNLSDPEDVVKVDELTFPERMDQYSWRRSLSATDEHLYIAGPRYGDGTEPEGSIIQVVDVSDHSGAMVEGDSIEVAGQINSRWQMDEYDDVLRVVSQPMWWRSEGVPEVETFAIESSEKLEPLGRVALELPRAEQLQAVRFDGPRGYAITFEQTDPLFTIDLSDPENPAQVGQLEMPGWVYYMEPRGDRVIGLGFDQGNAEGSLTVSLFDVSDLSAPTMVDRVNFGGDWAQLAEDQDRIHKSFQVLDDDNLILVPFSGWVYDQRDDECRNRNTYVSGVQLVDWEDDSLSLKGVAESQGQSRRAFIHQERLLTMSDERLEAFDISDRDAPESTSLVDLAQIVNQLATVGDTVVRVGDSWWGDELQATVSSVDDLLHYQPGVTLELPGVNTSDCTSESWFNTVISGGDSAYFLYNHSDWSNEQDYKEQLRVLTLDVSDPKHPEVAGDAELGFQPAYGRRYVPGMVDNGQPSLSLGDALVFAQHDIEYNNRGFVTKNDYSIEVVDLSNPAKPKRSSVPMPDSLGSTGLLQSGAVVTTSHFETSPTNPNAVRFYLDRVDVSDPSDPKALESVNIPGSLLAYDADSAQALTVDYKTVTIDNISPQQCYEEEFGNFLAADPTVVDWEKARGACQALRYTLQLVEIDDGEATIVDSYDVDKGVQVTAAAIGDDRVFIGTGISQPSRFGDYAPTPVAVSMPGIAEPIGIGGGQVIDYYSYGVQTSESTLLVASGLTGSKLKVAPVTIETTSNFSGFGGLIAKGTSAVVASGWQGRLSVIDASDASDPVVRDSAELGGSVRDLDLAGNLAIAALGQAGVQTIELE